MYNPELFKGTLKTIVLHLLQKHGKLYGYEIVKLVKDISKDQLQLTEGALYPTLHKLEKLGFVQTESFYTGKRIRKYYNLSEMGKINAVQSKEDFSEFVSVIKKILK